MKKSSIVSIVKLLTWNVLQLTWPSASPPENIAARPSAKQGGQVISALALVATVH